MTEFVYDIIQSNDILELAENLTHFIGETLTEEENAADMVNELYNELNQLVEISRYENNDFFRVLSGRIAVCAFLKQSWVIQSTVDESLSTLFDVINDINDEFIEANGIQLSYNEVEYIMNSLESKIHFYKKLFKKDEVIDVLMVNQSYKIFNSKVLLKSFENGKRKESIVMTYMPKDIKPASIVLLHEIGHIIHHRIAGADLMIPPRFLSLLNSLYGNSLEKMLFDIYKERSFDLRVQMTELFADFFSIAASCVFVPALDCVFVRAMIELFTHYIYDCRFCFKDFQLTLPKDYHNISVEILFVKMICTYFVDEINLAGIKTKHQL